jgi:hypothetical protein
VGEPTAARRSARITREMHLGGGVTGSGTRPALGVAPGAALTLGMSQVLHWRILASTVGDRLGRSWESAGRAAGAVDGTALGELSCRALGPHWRSTGEELGAAVGIKLGLHLARSQGPEPGETLGPVLETNWERSWVPNREALGRHWDQHSSELGPVLGIALGPSWEQRQARHSDRR